MRPLALLALAAALLVPVQAQAPAPPIRHVATMSELMVRLLYPASDALFYIETRTPKTDSEWQALEAQALIVAETANLLMLPGRARDDQQWMADSKLMLDAGDAALKAVKARSVEQITALNDQLYESCTTCHEHYRPGYARRP
ncbi:MAG: hypothetical protein AB1635_12940 [Acidobacteriota bacterium]